MGAVEPAQEMDFSATMAQQKFTQTLKQIPTMSELRASPLRSLKMEEARMRQRKSGGSGWFATVSRPDIRAWPARLASRINSSQGSDIYQINDLIKIVEEWRQATGPKYHSGPQRGTSSLAGWSAAAYGHQ